MKRLPLVVGASSASWSSSTPSSARSRLRSAAKRGSPGERRSPRSIWRSDETTPSTSTITRSASTIASSTSWVTRSTDGWCTAQSFLSRMCIRIRVSASSAPNGSSASSSSGSRTSERASAARCCSPPDSSCGQAFSRPASPTSASACLPRSRASRPRRPKMTLSSIRRHGSSRESWKTTDTRSGTSMDPCPATSRSSPASARSSVLLPLPLRPISATNSPGAISRSRPLSTPPASLKLRCSLSTRTARCPVLVQLPSVRRHASAFLSMRRTVPSAASPSRA